MTELENKFPTTEANGDEISPPDAGIESVEPLAEPVAPMAEVLTEVTEPKPEPEPESASDADAISEAEAPKEESKVRRIFRMLLRWTLGILIVFGVGFLTAVYMLFRPEVQSNRELQNQIQSEQQAAEEQFADLESQIAGLEGQIDDLNPLAIENEELLAAQGEFELHIAILDARLDVSNALLALAVNDPARARVSLEKTGDALATVSSMLPEDQRAMVTSMEQRLDLALTEMEDDPYAAQSDLDVLSKSLLELEDALFGMP
ncbi:MAG: hypothetical protein ISS57_18890 [Anaerolineales bacterium]|nr:hypothetical protein [Anaerolineales bacterium]